MRRVVALAALLAMGCGKAGPPRDVQDLVTATEGQAEHAVTAAVRVCKADREPGLASNASAAARAYAPLFTAFAACARAKDCADPGQLPAWTEAQKGLPDSERSQPEKTRAVLQKILPSSGDAERAGFAKLFDAGAAMMPSAEKVVVVCGNPARAGEVSTVLAELEAKRAAFRAEVTALRRPR